MTAATVTERELQMAAMLVDSYAADFAPGEFTDEYQVQLRELIDAKLSGGEGFAAPDATRDGQDAEVLDLLTALERSVARRGSSGDRHSSSGHSGHSGDGHSGSGRSSDGHSSGGQVNPGASGDGTADEAPIGQEAKPRRRKRA